jgi:hypothetical protein
MITVTQQGIKEAKRILSHVDEGIEKAVNRAGKRALKTGKRELSENIRKRYRVRANSKKPKDKHKTIAGNLKEEWEYSKLKGRLKVEGKALNLYDFYVSPRAPFRAGKTTKGKVKKRPESLSVAVLTGSKKKLFHAFVQKMPDHGHVGVYERVKGSKMKDKNREKIRELKSPSVATMAANKEVAPPSQKAIDDMFLKTLDHEVERLLKIK